MAWAARHDAGKGGPSGVVGGGAGGCGRAGRPPGLRWDRLLRSVVS